MNHRDYEPVDLQRGGFKVHQLEGFEKDNIENAFTGYVLEVLGKINDGKEATVYLCRMERGLEADFGGLAAAKIFKSRKFRNFDKDRGYRNFGKMRDRRAAKLMRGRSEKGDQKFHRHWVTSEWNMLQQLHHLGVRVPIPIAAYEDGVLMEFIGTNEGAAPRLINCRLDEPELTRVATCLHRDISTMLTNDIVHGDLSPYNVLYDGHEPVIIDVPQAVDLRQSPQAYAIAQRDLENLARFFEKQGADTHFKQCLQALTPFQ